VRTSIQARKRESMIGLILYSLQIVRVRSERFAGIIGLSESLPSDVSVLWEAPFQEKSVHEVLRRAFDKRAKRRLFRARSTQAEGGFSGFVGRSWSIENFS